MMLQCAIISRKHNNSNILALGSWMIDLNKAERIVEAWLSGNMPAVGMN